MDHGDASSRKRSYASTFSQVGGTDSYQSSEDYSLGDLLLASKRQRCGPNLTPSASDFNTLPVFGDFSWTLPDTCSSNIFTQQDFDTSFFDYDFSELFSLSLAASFDECTVDDRFSLSQDVATANSMAETPRTHTRINATYSPNSFYPQPELNVYDAAVMNETSGAVSERPEANLEDLPFGYEDYYHPNQLDSYQSTLGNDGPFNSLETSQLPTDIDDDSHFPPELCQDMQNSYSPNQVVLHSRNALNSHSGAWMHNLPQTTDTAKPLDTGLSNRKLVSIRPAPPVAYRALQSTPIQALNMSSIEFRNFTSHNVPSELSLPHRSSGHRLELKHRRHGCRSGSLGEETAESARKMRSIGACWQCKISKIPCSYGNPCKPCGSPSLSPGIICRLNFTELGILFIPDLVYERLSDLSISNFKKKNAVFTDNTLEVELTSGPIYPPMTVTVAEFRPLNQGALALDVVTSKQNAQDEYFEFTPSYAPPFGVDDTSVGRLKTVCKEHIKLIIEQERDIGEVQMGDTSLVSWKVFEAVNRYRRSVNKDNSNARLLEKAAMLHGIHYFMSRIIYLSDESAEKLVQGLRKPHALQFAETLTSTLLNLQIKQAMRHLLDDTVYAVLEKLEKSLFKAKHSAWGDIFCVVLILCICIEAVQVASDGYVMAALRKDPKCNMSRAQICRQLDEQPFKPMSELFHRVYKTRKVSRKNRVGFNPFQRAIKANAEEGITVQMVKLVDDIKQIISEHGEEMAQIAEDPSFEATPDILTSHMVFRSRNSGRLVSKFLMQFT